MLSRTLPGLLLAAIVGILALGDQATVRAAIATPAGSDIPGDVNCDDDLTVLDPLHLLLGEAGLPANDDCANANSDFNCDQTADEADVPQILRLLAGMQPEECPSTGDDPTSIELIDQALMKGDIEEDEAALYSVFAAFEDPRLPPQYNAGDAPEMELPIDMELIGSSLSGYSAEVRTQLEPFFIAPMHAGSWWDLRHNAAAAAPAGIDTAPGPILGGDWGSIDAQTAQVKLWYPLDNFAMHELATGAAQQLDSHIWPQLTALMGRQPLPDGGNLLPGRGGDNRIDIIVSNDAPTFGAVGLAPNWCEATSALIYANPEVAEGLAIPFNIAVGHELMHAIIFSYDLALQPGGNGGCADGGYNWWHEASATWTEDFLYPAMNTEHAGVRGNRNLEAFTSELASPLEFGGSAYFGTTGRPYGAYLWAFHVAHEYGNDIIRQMWENMQGQGSIEAMESALQPHGGFEMVWPDFILNVFNKAPFDDFRQWDGIQQEPRDDVPGGGSTYRDMEDVKLNSCVANACFDRDGAFRLGWVGNDHLSASADSYAFVDENVRAVTFHNGYAYNIVEQDEPSLGKFFTIEPRPEEEIRGLKVQALIKIAGQPWVLEDWTVYSARTFCRDKASERIEEIIIITTNSVTEKDYRIDSPGAGKGPRGHVSDIGCLRWEGTVTNRYYDDTDGFEEKIVLKDAVLEVGPYFPYAGQILWRFFVAQGSIDWDYHWAPGECVYDGSERGMQPTDVSSLETYTGVTEGPYHRAAAGVFNAAEDGLVTVTCPGDPPETFDEAVGVVFPHDLIPFQLEHGGVIDGGFNTSPSPGNVGVEASWHFEAQRE